jgi:hypothetical protein
MKYNQITVYLTSDDGYWFRAVENENCNSNWIAADTMTQHYITNEITINTDTIQDHGGNGLTADHCVCLKSAEDFDGNGGRWYYLSTNGNDVLVGWIDSNSEEGLVDEIADWIGNEDAGWLRDLLQTLGFDLSTVAAE